MSLPRWHTAIDCRQNPQDLILEKKQTADNVNLTLLIEIVSIQTCVFVQLSTTSVFLFVHYIEWQFKKVEQNQSKPKFHRDWNWSDKNVSTKLGSTSLNILHSSFLVCLSLFKHAIVRQNSATLGNHYLTPSDSRQSNRMPKSAHAFNKLAPQMLFH